MNRTDYPHALAASLLRSGWRSDEVGPLVRDTRAIWEERNHLEAENRTLQDRIRQLEAENTFLTRQVPE